MNHIITFCAACGEWCINENGKTHPHVIPGTKTVSGNPAICLGGSLSAIPEISSNYQDGIRSLLQPDSYRSPIPEYYRLSEQDLRYLKTTE